MSIKTRIDPSQQTLHICVDESEQTSSSTETRQKQTVHHKPSAGEETLSTKSSLKLLQKVESGMGCSNWHAAMHRPLATNTSVNLLSVGSVGNERANRLASTADITCGLQLGRAEVLGSLRNFLNMDRPEHHSIDRLKERGVEKGSGRHSTPQGRERYVFNQANIGTVSRATLRRLLRDGAERVWAFPSATMPS